jgi:hypothetical protein
VQTNDEITVELLGAASSCDSGLVDQLLATPCDLEIRAKPLWTDAVPARTADAP